MSEVRECYKFEKRVTKELKNSFDRINLLNKYKIDSQVTKKIGYNTKHLSRNCIRPDNVIYSINDDNKVLLVVDAKCYLKSYLTRKDVVKIYEDMQVFRATHAILILSDTTKVGSGLLKDIESCKEFISVIKLKSDVFSGLDDLILRIHRKGVDMCESHRLEVVVESIYRKSKKKKHKQSDGCDIFKFFILLIIFTFILMFIRYMLLV